MTSTIDLAGWAIVSFLWQGTAIGLATASALWIARRARAAIRYAVACAGLMAMVAAPVWTVAANQPADPLPGGQWVASRLDVPDAVRDGGTEEPQMVAAAAAGPSSGAAFLPRAWFPLIVALWASGVLLLTARLAAGWWSLRGLHRRLLAAPASAWQAACDRLAARLNMQRFIHVVESAALQSPAVVGWMRPVIVLPMAAFAQLTPSQVEAILAHELAHIRRHDYLVNLAQTVAETLLFYHPAVWWLSDRVRLEREHCCDEVALLVCGDPVGYVEALTEIESWRLRRTNLALAATGGSLVDRARRILGDPEYSARPSSYVIATFVLILAIGVSAAAVQRSSAPTPPTPPAAPTPPAPSTPARPATFDVKSSFGDLRRTVEIGGQGVMSFTDDLTDVRSIAAGAFLTIRERNWLTVRRVEIRGTPGGVTRKFFVAGAEQPWEPDGRVWLADRLPYIVRHTGMAAEARTRQLLAEKGVDGVFAEIQTLDSDFAQRLYFQHLFKLTPLDAAAAGRAATLAGTVIQSDYELRQALESMTDRATSAAARRALVAAAAAIQSDYECATLLAKYTNDFGIEAEVADSYFAAVRTIQSDYERGRVLKTTTARAPLAPETLRAVLRAVAEMNSDYEQAEVLMTVVKGQPIDAVTRTEFIKAADAIHSEYEQTRVLAALVRAEAR